MWKHLTRSSLNVKRGCPEVRELVVSAHPNYGLVYVPRAYLKRQRTRRFREILTDEGLIVLIPMDMDTAEAVRVLEAVRGTLEGPRPGLITIGGVQRCESPAQALSVVEG